MACYMDCAIFSCHVTLIIINQITEKKLTEYIYKSQPTPSVNFSSSSSVIRQVSNSKTIDTDLQFCIRFALVHLKIANCNV